MEDIIDKTIFGTPTDPAPWRMPYDPKRKTIQAVSFENWKTRQIMYQLEPLVEVSIWDARKNSIWLHLLPYYRRFMVQLCEKENWNTKDKMALFQLDIDTKVQDWVQLGMVTNYMHLMEEGHVMEYIGHYGNLYKHSQQG